MRPRFCWRLFIASKINRFWRAAPLGTERRTARGPQVLTGPPAVRRELAILRLLAMLETATRRWISAPVSRSIRCFSILNLSSNSNNNTLTINGSGTTTISSPIANGGTSTASNLTYSGSGTLLLTGNNTYGGTTTINGGTLLVSNTSGSGTGTGNNAS